MRLPALIGITLCFTGLVSGCSGDEVKRATYEAAYQRTCIDQSGAPNCDPGHKDYETYTKERSQVLQPE